MNLKKLSKDTSILTFGMGLRALTQGLVFIIIARFMGIEGYGTFVSIIAISGILSGLVAFGSHVLLTRDTALNRENFNKAWGQTLLTIGLSIPFAFLLYILLAYFILPKSISWTPILLIGIADLVFWPLSNVCVSAYQGFERIGRASRMVLIPVIIRLMATLVLLYIGLETDITSPNQHPNILTLWSALYLGSAALATLYTQWRVFNDLGKPIFSTHKLLSRAKEGLPFSFWAISDKLYADSDKVMLAHMTTVDITGAYSAAYRLVDLSFTPIHGLVGAATPHFFKHANIGFQSVVNYTAKLIKLPFIIAVLMSVVIYLSATIIPLILGKEFIKSIEIVQLLSIMPVIILPRLLMQSILATSHLQKTGMRIILTGAVINIGCNLLSIPKWGWYGAVVSTYIAEISMSLIMAIVLSNELKKNL